MELREEGFDELRNSGEEDCESGENRGFDGRWESVANNSNYLQASAGFFKEQIRCLLPKTIEEEEKRTEGSNNLDTVSFEGFG